MDTLKEYAKKNHVPVLKDESFDFLCACIRQYDCHSLLELGTAIAKTSIGLAQTFPELTIVTIERDPKMIEQATINIAQSGVSDRIQLIEGDALEANVEGSFDCLFIDAAKAQYRRFFEKYVPLLTPGGIIISDNMNFHGLVEHPENTNNRNTKALVRKIRAYREYLDSLEEFETSFYDIGDGVAVTRRKK